VAKIDRRLSVYFTAVTFLHVAYRATKDPPLKPDLLDILATTCLQSIDARRCLDARHSSVLSLSLAAKLMKVVANKSRRRTVELIEIELSKAYLYRAFRCDDYDRDYIYCLTNVYLAVLYYITREYQTATDHCKLLTRSQGHSQSSLRAVQGELLPKIDDEIDSVLGLAVFFLPVRLDSCIESTTTNTTCQRLYYGIVYTLSAHQMSVNHKVSPSHTNVIN